MQPWHEQDAFWQTVGPTMFSQRRRTDAPAEVEGILRMLGIEPGVPLLDLCCGVGRHSLEFARRGFRVTGVDRTRAYLEQASRQAAAEGLPVEFVEEDMRAFVRPGAFAAAVNLFTSFGFFEDPDEDRRVVANVYQSLQPGGAFLIDVGGKEVLARVWQERDWHEEDDILILQERKVSQAWGWMENRWILVQDGRRTEFTVSHRLYAATELAALLRACGFSHVEVYGSLDGSAYDQTARRLVVVGRKP
ncbi:MAG: methyltransferase domain-containing protein [Chloroflexi bacterium]|nr:methyltransferase domain-containing protein [Chloroflexota bacterium]